MDYKAQLAASILAAKDFIKVGKSYVVNYALPARHPSRSKIHVRAIVDEEVVVYRTWSTRHRCWRYKAEPFYYFALQLEHNRIKRG